MSDMEMLRQVDPKGAVLRGFNKDKKENGSSPRSWGGGVGIAPPSSGWCRTFRLDHFRRIYLLQSTSPALFTNSLLLRNWNKPIICGFCTVGD